MQKHIISLLVDNEPGVLSRVAGLFSGRGFNIESLCVAETMNPSVSRMTLVTRGDEHIVEQIKKQLNKLINVIKVHDLTGTEFVQREMALVKVKAKRDYRAEILRIVDIFRCKVVDVSPTHYTIEATGTAEKLGAILGMLKPIGIKEIARTGAIALSREKKGKEGAYGKD
ncbi:MAG: acetolactate synthase small subunit [Deltaproteobacteria bacterium]|nr:acetolactate synthase small subunit [Deltaproteobacteria bacterium]MCD6137063.1 acetolactate synthase small subunit [Deltaproteobacteria bacterium]RLB90760.1 MAG: acetolactate synthase small subunit [Deltaproteobacteria bacterium]RLB90784.1 MAG: acetolactate synthase small subunit [Deltaproteobacteria bacterium]RLC12301.1 MAG: acetolactate synthase small subunit [Deltaproteobacteria bacterium]